MDFATATALDLILFVASAFVSHRMMMLEVRATREELASILRHETERLEQKIDTFVNANVGARVMAAHAVTCAERAAAVSSKPVVLVVAPANDVNETQSDKIRQY